MSRSLQHDVLAATAGQRDAVRDHILDAAHRVIAAHGLSAASTRAIALDAGVSVGTLYNYFGDRLTLLAEAMFRRAHLMSGDLAQLPERAGRDTVAANLQYVAGKISVILDQLVPLFAAAFADPALLTAIRKGAASPGSRAGPMAVHPVEHYLLAEQDLGRVAAGADCSAAASLILSLCHDRAFRGYFHGSRMPPVSNEIDLIAHAIAPRTEPQCSANTGS